MRPWQVWCDPGREGLLPKEMTEFIPPGWKRFISKADASLGGGQGPGDRVGSWVKAKAEA